MKTFLELTSDTTGLPEQFKVSDIKSFGVSHSKEFKSEKDPEYSRPETWNVSVSGDGLFVECEYKSKDAALETYTKIRDAVELFEKESSKPELV